MPHTNSLESQHILTNWIMTTYPNLEIRSSQLNSSEPFADFNHCINCSFEVTVCSSRQMKFVPQHPKTKFGTCRILANNIYIYIYINIYTLNLYSSLNLLHNVCVRTFGPLPLPVTFDKHMIPQIHTNLRILG